MCAVGCNLFGIVKDMSAMTVGDGLDIVVGPMKVCFRKQSNVSRDGFDIV